MKFAQNLHAFLLNNNNNNKIDENRRQNGRKKNCKIKIKEENTKRIESMVYG